MPPPVTRASRLPGTYAANSSGGDMNWRRGVGTLWVLFGLAVALEFVRASFQLLAGYTHWPTDLDVVRVGLSSLALLTLWAGWGWTRWVLVVVDFLCGLHALAWGIAGHMDPNSATSQAMRAASPLVGTLPSIGLGLVYVCTAAYVAFSADVVDFVRHRREEGRGWVLGPVLLLVGAYLAVLFTLEVPYLVWIKAREGQARRFGDDLSRRMAEHWDPRSIDGLGDKAFDTAWTPEVKQGAFGSLAPLGPLVKADKVDMYPMATQFDLASGGFIMQYSYNLRQARFAHGTADIGVFVVKPLFGPWEIDNMTMSDLHFDPKPGEAADKISPGAAQPTPEAGP